MHESMWGRMRVMIDISIVVSESLVKGAGVLGIVSNRCCVICWAVCKCARGSIAYSARTSASLMRPYSALLPVTLLLTSRLYHARNTLLLTTPITSFHSLFRSGPGHSTPPACPLTTSFTALLIRPLPNCILYSSPKPHAIPRSDCGSRDCATLRSPRSPRARRTHAGDSPLSINMLTFAGLHAHFDGTPTPNSCCAPMHCIQG